jgi:hypothetical protein
MREVVEGHEPDDTTGLLSNPHILCQSSVAEQYSLFFATTSLSLEYLYRQPNPVVAGSTSASSSIAALREDGAAIHVYYYNYICAEEQISPCA